MFASRNSVFNFFMMSYFNLFSRLIRQFNSENLYRTVCYLILTMV